jgi:Helix-hairpin-helix domain
MQQTRAAPPAILEAVLERITYANEQTGYTVARVATNRSSDLLTVVGPLLGAQPGESLRLQGRWASHPQYGRQFQVDSYTTVLPATIQGIRRYLGSGLIKGIGPKMAERIVDHFGQATLEVIEQAPGRLVEVPGLGPKRTAMITAAWAEQQAIKEVMVFLQGLGCPPRLGCGSTRPTATTHRGDPPGAVSAGRHSTGRAPGPKLPARCIGGAVLGSAMPSSWPDAEVSFRPVPAHPRVSRRVP